VESAGIEEGAMTQEQAESYLASGGIVCPFCKSENLGGGEYEMGQGIVFLPIHCNDCGEGWTDEYSLTGVTEIEETTCPHVPHNLETLQTVCELCGESLFFDAKQDTWITQTVEAA
jgi:hypothetical protein